MDIEEFKSPREDLLEKCTEDQLLKLAEHYEISNADKNRKLKDQIKSELKTALFEKNVLVTTPDQPLPSDPSPPSVPSTGHLTFEQQKELLQLQIV